MIIQTNKQLKEYYHKLKAGDIFLGTLNHRNLKKEMLIDLLERGVKCFPSALSQILSSSKAAQATILSKWMLPHTRVIGRRLELIDAINSYNKHGIGAVITKEDHLHCGHGIRRWDNIEILYNFTALNDNSHYPFILQPFLENFTDVRVIIAGDYVEAYIRKNPYNFRMNIAAGGKSSPYLLKSHEEEFCRNIMERGKFPYAHTDLHITEKEEYYLSEITLNAGIKGAHISRNELNRKKAKQCEIQALK
ncbi:ATP-grasp fold RimK-type domain-containing protein [Candidatus Magnetomoraceae bacterium gMMP-1]